MPARNGIFVLNLDSPRPQVTPPLYLLTRSFQRRELSHPSPGLWFANDSEGRRRIICRALIRSRDINLKVGTSLPKCPFWGSSFVARDLPLRAAGSHPWHLGPGAVPASNSAPAANTEPRSVRSSQVRSGQVCYSAEVSEGPRANRTKVPNGQRARA